MLSSTPVLVPVEGTTSAEEPRRRPVVRIGSSSLTATGANGSRGYGGERSSEGGKWKLLVAREADLITKVRIISSER